MNQLTQVNPRLPIACRNAGFERGACEGFISRHSLRVHSEQMQARQYPVPDTEGTRLPFFGREKRRLEKVSQQVQRIRET